MKTEFTYKIKVGEGVNPNERGSHLLIRVLTEEKVSPQTCFNNIIEYKRQVANMIENTRHSDWLYLKDQLERLSQYKIIYSKMNEISQDNKTYYYYQFIVEGEPLHASDGVRWRYDLFCNLNAIESLCMNVPMPIIPFSVSGIEMNINTSASPNFCRCLSGELSNLFTKLSVYYNENIALLFRTDTTKKYNRNAIVKIEGSVYDNLVQALNDKDSNTVFGSCLDGVNTITFTQWGNRCGVYRFKKMYTTKIHSLYYKDMLINYDSKRAYETMTPYFEDLYNSGLKNVQIIQFSGNKDFYYAGMTSSNIPKMIFRFVDTSRIIIGKSNFATGRRPTGVIGNICIKAHKGQKNLYINLDFNPFSNYRGTLIVPIIEGQVNEDSLRFLIQAIKTESFSNGQDEYLNSLKGKIDMTEDIISTWFNYCIKAKKKGTHDLVSAYEKMKANLESEYSVLKNYIEAYDFSKCMAIPTIKMDNKLKENYYKSLHVETKSVIIKSIKREQIRPITIIQPTILFMETGKNTLIRGSFPLKDYYKIRDNMVDLQYDKLKGDAIHAKAQNRR